MPNSKLTAPWLALTLSPALAISAPEPPVTLLAKPLSLKFQDEMTVGAGTEGDVKWRLSKGQWDRSSTGSVVSERASDQHGAVGRIPLKLTNFVLQVDVRIDGAKSATISINDEKEHVARVGISSSGFYLRKDDHDHDGPDRPVVFFTSQDKVESGTWHTITLEMVGETMVAALDGKISGWGTDKLFSAPKANPGLTVAGQSATFRNFRIWEAASEPIESWPLQREKMQKPNLKPQEPVAPKTRPPTK